MNAQTRLTARTSWGQPTTANSNLDGVTGSYKNVVAGSLNGTLIKTIIVKAIVSTTTDGMVRLFVQKGSIVTILMEIPVPHH